MASILSASLSAVLLAPPKTRPNLARALAPDRAKDRASIQMAVPHFPALRAHGYISQQSYPPSSATRPPSSVFLRGLSADQIYWHPLSIAPEPRLTHPSVLGRSCGPLPPSSPSHRAGRSPHVSQPDPPKKSECAGHPRPLLPGLLPWIRL